MPHPLDSPFTQAERDLIRLELTPRFGQDRSPKIPKAIQTMLDRGLVRIGRNPMGRPAAFFTEAGMEGLRQLLRDRRMMGPERFDYLRRELGMNGPPAAKK